VTKVLFTVVSVVYNCNWHCLSLCTGIFGLHQCQHFAVLCTPA